MKIIKIIQFITLIFCTYSILGQFNRFYFEFDPIGRNIEQYKTVISSPYIGDIYEEDNKFTDIFIGHKNFSIGLKYALNKYVRIHIGYEKYDLYDREAYNFHSLCGNCGYGYLLSGIVKAHTYPLHFEFLIPTSKCSKRIYLLPVVGFALLYNELPSSGSSSKFSTEIKYYEIPISNLEATSITLPKSNWNFALRYGIGIEWNIYKDIRFKFNYLFQHGLYEISRLNIDVEQKDLITNKKNSSSAIQSERQTLLSKRFSLLFPLDWISKVTTKKKFKEIFAK